MPSFTKSLCWVRLPAVCLRNLRATCPVVPWRDIIGMRSIVTHGYDQIDDDELWKVVCRDLAKTD